MTVFSFAADCGLYARNAIRRIARDELGMKDFYRDLEPEEVERLRPRLKAEVLRRARAEGPALPGMTIQAIADVCLAGESTVKDWIRVATKSGAAATGIGAGIASKMEGAGHGKITRFSLPEVLAIVRAGGRGPLADLLEANAKLKAETAKAPPPPKAGKLPAGVQMKEMRLIYGDKEASKRLDFILGYQLPVVHTIEERADAATAEKNFRGLLSLAVNGPKQPELGEGGRPA